MKEKLPPLAIWTFYNDGTVTVESPYSKEPPKIWKKGEPIKEPCPEPSPRASLKPPYKQLTCKRCNHSWTPRSKKIPTQCPKCHSPYWNRERKDTHR
jgi:hypothetical protein